MQQIENNNNKGGRIEILINRYPKPRLTARSLLGESHTDNGKGNNTNPQSRKGKRV